MQFSPYSNDEYTIGWISALNEEFMLAMAMLDEEHGRPQSTPRDDTNAYHLGRIGAHNITMASLSGGQMGTGPAAVVAENMRRTFKNIRFALLVGIGGGVPSETKDIRLGDIVVSYPNGTYTGVVQYDYGKLNGNGVIERKDWFCAPPPKVLAAVDLLRAYHGRPKNPRNNIQSILSELGEQYIYPAEHMIADQLFRAEYDHSPGAETCDCCDKKELVQRKTRISTSNPYVHYGIVASGSMVVKSGVERDKIDRRYANTIFCFDMEAAGLMNNFPCLIIRGISDYSDSHKNDKWRKRATAVASAYAKELLSLIEPSDVEVLPPIAARVLDAVSQSIAKIDESTAENTKLLENAEKEARQRELKDLQIQCGKWLKPLPNVRQIQQEGIEAKLPGTCDWIWSNTTFTNWKALTPPSPLDGLLCICGPPGCGKSILASSIVDHMRKNGIYALFFAFTGMYASHRKLDSLIRSLIWQLMQVRPGESAIHILRNFIFNGPPTTADLWTAFSMTADTFIAELIYCIVDGIDEGKDFVHELVQKLLDFLQTHSNFRFIVLGRSHAFHAIDSVRHKIEIDSTLTKGDVDTVIETAITQSDILNIPDLRSEIYRTLTEQSEGNFLWIKIMVRHLNKSVSVADAVKRLRNLPSGLQTAYEDLLDGLSSRLEGSELNLAQKVFAFIIVSQRPLSLEEFQYLFAADAMTTSMTREHSIEDYLILQPDCKIPDVCGGLVIIVNGHLRLVHFSVMEFLIRPESQWLHSSKNLDIQKFRIVLKQAHGWLATASMEYLETCYYSSQTHDWNDSPKLVKHNQLLGYSSRYSAAHIIQSDIKPGVIAAKIDRFLNTDRCVTWIEYFVMTMIDDESIDSQFEELEEFMSWLGEAGQSLSISQRAFISLNHELERRSQQYGESDARTEQIRLFLDVFQDEFISTSPQAAESSLIGSAGTPTDISPILQILRNEAPLSLELKTTLLLKLQTSLQKIKLPTDLLQIIFRMLLEKVSEIPIHALLPLGDFYRRIGKLEQALEIYLAALDKLERTEARVKYVFISRIGNIYDDLKQYDKSLEYNTRALAGWEKIRGPEHNDAMITVYNIGCTYDDLKQYDKSLEYYTRALAGWEKLFGPGHKHTLESVHGVACAYDNLKQYDKSLEYYTRALAGWEKIMGPEHEDTLLIVNDINRVRDNLKQSDKASDDLTHTFSRQEKIPRLEHKDTPSTANNASCAYNNLEQHNKTSDDQTKILAGQENKVLGSERKNTKLIQRFLGIICCNFER